MIKYIIAAIAALSLFTCMQSANAAFTTYNLDNVTFTDGGLASGFLQFDTTTDTLGTVDITTTAGSNPNFTGQTYDSTTIGGDEAFTNFNAQFNTSGDDLQLITVDPLTTSGTFALMSSSSEEGGNKLRFISSGFLTTSVIAAPEPSGLSAMIIAIVGLFGMLGWKKMRTAVNNN